MVGDEAEPLLAGAARRVHGAQRDRAAHKLGLAKGLKDELIEPGLFHADGYRMIFLVGREDIVDKLTRLPNLSPLDGRD
jgi:hypothetical protein